MNKLQPGGAEILVRKPAPDDGPGIGLAHVLAWQVGYRGVIPDTYLDGLDPVDRGRIWTQRLRERQTAPANPDDSNTIVAEVAGRIAGFASYGPYRTTPGKPPGRLCELWALNVHPDHWGTGAAQALMATALDDLRAVRSEPTAALWVLEANARGRRFYEKVGWSADGETKTDEFAGTAVTEVRYTRRL